MPNNTDDIGGHGSDPRAPGSVDASHESMHRHQDHAIQPEGGPVEGDSNGSGGAPATVNGAGTSANNEITKDNPENTAAAIERAHQA